MKKELNLTTWNRKDHFNFFKQFEEPFFGVTVDVDVTVAYKKAKEQNVSFFLYYLHKSIVAANSVEAFRYRINDDKVYIYDFINPSPTINRPDNTFGFSYISYAEDFNDFLKIATKEIERVRNTTGLNPATSGENVIHYSSIPWIKFTSLSHARSFTFPDSCPKISFGKMTETNGKKIMPMSVHVHHALMDGYEVGLYIKKFQDLLNQ
ncbi:chloramphenicol acetyltransferase [Urechidicola croceus]|uniref:Chloramphenicol acetyltransferase n=1 Tax=Urechidicola croceus TaxID=1850246 RepID=A0A1D8PBD8_9FLAO|nr:chloramphenicol acetyltransferase [Urechidicola croceus]AOW21905.1 chloramphenicol acetyltransferase [Urechidicola croceus]